MIEFEAGSVWWVMADFNDGEGPRKKFLVLLSDCPQDGEPAFVCYTTSRGEKRFGVHANDPSPCGEAFFRIAGGDEACFPLITWVEFTNNGILSRAHFAKLQAIGQGGFVQTLSEQRVRTMLNCAKKSEDIPTRNLEQIDKALKARAPAKQPAKLRAPTPSAPPPFISPEIISTRMRVDRLCVDCRAIFVDLVEINAPDLTSILQGKTKAPDNFLKKAQDGFELLDAEKCSSCAKR